MQPRAFTLLAYGTQEKADKTTNILTSFNKHITGSKCVIDGPGVLGYVDDQIEQGYESILEWLKTTAETQDGKYVINMAGYSRGGLVCLRTANRLNAILQSYATRGLKLKDKSGQEINVNNVEVNIYAMDPVAGPGSKGDFSARDIPPIVKKCIFTLQKHERRQEFIPQDFTRLGAINFQQTSVSINPMFGEHSTTTLTQSPDVNDCTLLNWYHFADFLVEHGSFVDSKNYPELVDWYNNWTKFPVELAPSSCDEKGVKSADSSKDKKDGEANTSTDTSARGAKTKHGLKNPNSFKYVHHYTRAKLNEEKYRAKGTAWHWTNFLVKKHRSFTHHLEDYVADHDYFINQFHRDAFADCYPNTFKHLFTDRLETLSDTIKGELLAQSDEFIEWLRNQAIEFRGKNASLPAHPKYSLKYIELHCPNFNRYLSGIQGVHEELASMPQDVAATLRVRGLSVSHEAQYVPLCPQGKPVIESNPIAAPDSALTLFRQIRQIIFDYRRVKSRDFMTNELMTYTDRDEAERAEDIELKIKDIISSASSENDKKKRLLKFLEEQYIELVERNSSSELRKSFKITLEKFSNYKYKEKEDSHCCQAPAVGASECLFFLGYLVKFFGQILSTVFGIVGDVTSAVGRGFTNLRTFPQVGSFFELHPALLIIGYPLSLLVALPLKYLVGYPIRGLGYCIKHGFTFLEMIGKGIRYCGKLLVGASGRFSVEKTLRPVPQDKVGMTSSGGDSKVILKTMLPTEHKSLEVAEQKHHAVLDTSRLYHSPYRPGIWRQSPLPAVASGLYGARLPRLTAPPRQA